MTIRTSHPILSLQLAAIPLAIVSVFAATASADDPPSSPKSTISINVGNFRNRSGSLGCRLYRSSKGFPEETSGTVEKRTTVTGTVTPCTFENVAPGTYAISVMHDENDNQKLDKNFLGIPTEGYGVSNNHTHAMSAPSWDDSKFVVESGKNVALGIGLRY